MEREELDRLKQLFRSNLIGPDELKPLIEKLGWGTDVIIPEMNYTSSQLEQCAKDYLLVMGIPEIGGKPVTIRTLREAFGFDPDESKR